MKEGCRYIRLMKQGKYNEVIDSMKAYPLPEDGKYDPVHDYLLKALVPLLRSLCNGSTGLLRQLRQGARQSGQNASAAASTNGKKNKKKNKKKKKNKH